MKSKLRWKERNLDTRDCFDTSTGRRVGEIERDDSFNGPKTWQAHDVRKHPYVYLGEYATEVEAKSAVERALKGDRK